MRAKSEKRLEAERLRREEGLSYNEIAARTSISKSTLSHWLRDIPLTPEQQTRLQERLKANRATFAARAWPINKKRYAQARREAWQSGADVVAQLPSRSSVDELAFAMLYLGEGAKSANRIELASTNPDILRYVIWALKHLYKVPDERIVCRMHLIELAHPIEEQVVQWWMQQLDMPREQFRQTTYDRRPRSVKLSDDYHGVCVVSHFDTYLQQHLLGLAHTYLATRIGKGNEGEDKETS